MLLKKEVHKNLEKGREWAAGGRVGGSVVCFSVSSATPHHSPSAGLSYLLPISAFLPLTAGLKYVSSITDLL